MNQCKGTTRRGGRCRRRGALVHRGFCATHAPKFYLGCQSQIDRARALFDWWWETQRPGVYNPAWEECDREIQAFWMDGAWRVSQHV